MHYRKPRFSVAQGTTEAFRTEHERIFGKRPVPADPHCEICSLADGTVDRVRLSDGRERLLCDTCSEVA